MENKKLILEDEKSENLQLRTKKDVVDPYITNLHQSLEDLIFQHYGEFFSRIDLYEREELEDFLSRVKRPMKRLMEILYYALPYFKENDVDLRKPSKGSFKYLGKGTLYTLSSLLLGEFSRIYWGDVVYAIQNPVLDITMYKPSDIFLGTLFGVLALGSLYLGIKNYSRFFRSLKERKEVRREVESVLKRLEKMSVEERIEAVDLMSFTLLNLGNLYLIVFNNSKPEISLNEAYETIHSRLMKLKEEEDFRTREVIDLYNNREFLQVVSDFLSHLGANYMFRMPNLFHEDMGREDPIIYSQEFFRQSHIDRGFYTNLNSCEAFLSLIERRER